MLCGRRFPPLLVAICVLYMVAEVKIGSLLFFIYYYYSFASERWSGHTIQLQRPTGVLPPYEAVTVAPLPREKHDVTEIAVYLHGRTTHSLVSGCLNT